MKKFLVAIYVVIAVAIFTLGSLSAVDAIPADEGPTGTTALCSTYFPGTCTQGGCPATTLTYATNCIIYNCYGGVNNQGDVIYWNLVCQYPPEPVEDDAEPVQI